jgi:hypothetical protein
MKSFKTYITEIMDNPYEYISLTQSLESYRAGFLTGSGNAYVVYLYLYGLRRPTVEILFGKIDDIYEISSLEDLRILISPSTSMKLQPIDDLEEALRVFATVKQIVKDYVSLAKTKNYDINKIFFSADTNEPSRVKMYDVLTAKLAKELNLDIETDYDRNSKLYALRKWL